MDIVKLAVMRPVAVLVGVLLVVLFGLVSLKKIPYQLSPNVTEPEITVRTFWPGATPYEVERDIIEEQEKYLKGVPKLREMESSSGNSQGTITLRFDIGTDIDDALLRVSNKINEVPNYPENVERPVISATGSETSPVVWLMLMTLEDNPRPIETYRTFFENEVRQYLERVDGVAELFVGGGTEDEMHVIVSPEKLAAHELTVDDVIRALQRENANISAGTMGVGRREYRIRALGEFRSAEDITDVVIRSDGQRRVRIGDVAGVQFGYAKRDIAILVDGKPGIGCGIRPEADANVLELTDELERVVNNLNDTLLAEEGIYLNWSYDQRPYIRGAIDLLKTNILIGGTLAVIVLFVFLRSFAATFVVATAIPISIVGTFFFMRVAGSTLNVVSLAGIAFAIGMLVDNAIVVLENIDRHRRMGDRPRDAAYTGTKEIWGAVLASTLTTVAVFLPVVFLEEEAGQLFRDIAIAVSSAVIISLLVSVLVIPMLSRQIFRLHLVHRLERKTGGDGNGLLARSGAGIRDALVWIVGLAMHNALTRLVTVVVLAGGAIMVSRALLPPMEYLPQGNRNFIINILVAPPGMSYEERQKVGEQIVNGMRPYFGPGNAEHPGVDRMFYVGAEGFMIYGAIASQEQRAGELIPICQQVMSRIPGFIGISTQAGVFQQGLGKGRTIDLNFKGADLDRLIAAAGAMFGIVQGGFEGIQPPQPVPSIEQIYPEAHFVPRRDRLVASGMDAYQFGVALDVLMDGRDVGDFKQEGKKKIDLVVKASETEVDTPEALYHSLIATSRGDIVPVSSLSDLVRTAGITEIRHLERDRTMTLRITPPPNVTIQEAMERIEGELLPQLRQTGLLAGINASMTGSADKLTEVRRALQWNFVLAVLITYLLMSALFGNFIYPLIIMVTVPMAAAGGFLGLKAVNLLIAPQQFDVLTMLGFVILVGVVVNNAILIVHQALNNIRDAGMHYREAVVESVRTRIRPIYMSATTSIFGMLPIVVAPGPGSELYRGLGSVVLGGLAISTIFTVFLIPSLLIFVIRMEKPRDNGLSAEAAADVPAPHTPGA